MSDAKVTVEQIRKRLSDKSGALNELLNNPVGKKLIKALEDEFYHGELFNADPYTTAYNCGRRDVVVYFKQLQNYYEKENYGTGIT